MAICGKRILTLKLMATSFVFGTFFDRIAYWEQMHFWVTLGKLCGFGYWLECVRKQNYIVFQNYPKNALVSNLISISITF